MEIYKKKIIILGGTGFIGKNLVSRHIANGDHVISYSRSKSHALSSTKGVTQLEGSLTEAPAILKPYMQNAIIYNLIMSTTPSANTDIAKDELVDNLVPLLELLKLSKHYDNKWIFLSSGGTVYGNPAAQTISEKEKLSPLCTYGIVKVAAESYYRVFGELNELNYTIVRLSNPYGYEQTGASGQGVIATAILKALKGEEFILWGDGNIVRDYIFITDVIDALCKISSSPKTGETYNLGSGIGTSLNQIIQIVSESEKTPQLRVSRHKDRKIDVQRNVLNIDKLKHTFNWSPKIDLKTGIELHTQWLVENYTSNNNTHVHLNKSK